MDLNEERKSKADQEKSLARWHVNKIKEARKYFDYADLSQNILEQQKEDDLLLLQEWLVNVHSKLKDEDSRKDEVFNLIKSVWRLQSYCGGLETICKSSTVIVLTHMKRIEELESELRICKLKEIQNNAKNEKEISTLKKQIEFHENNSKRK